VDGGLQVALHHLAKRGRRRREIDRRQIEQLVERRRHSRPLGKAVALGEGPNLIGADAIDEPVEMLPRRAFDRAPSGSSSIVSSAWCRTAAWPARVPEAHLLLPRARTVPATARWRRRPGPPAGQGRPRRRRGGRSRAGAGTVSGRATLPEDPQPAAHRAAAAAAMQRQVFRRRMRAPTLTRSVPEGQS